MIIMPIKQRPIRPMVLLTPASPIQNVDEIEIIDGMCHRIASPTDPNAMATDQPATIIENIKIPGMNKRIKLNGAKIKSLHIMLIARPQRKSLSTFLISAIMFSVL